MGGWDVMTSARDGVRVGRREPAGSHCFHFGNSCRPRALSICIDPLRVTINPHRSTQIDLDPVDATDEPGVRKRGQKPGRASWTTGSYPWTRSPSTSASTETPSTTGSRPARCRPTVSAACGSSRGRRSTLGSSQVVPTRMPRRAMEVMSRPRLMPERPARGRHEASRAGVRGNERRPATRRPDHQGTPVQRADAGRDRAGQRPVEWIEVDEPSGRVSAVLADLGADGDDEPAATPPPAPEPPVMEATP